MVEGPSGSFFHLNGDYSFFSASAGFIRAVFNAMIACSRSQIVTLDKKGRGSNVKYKPFVFTELGVAMLSSVLKSETAIQAVNDLSEDVRKDIDNLYLAIGELSSRIEEKKREPQRRIGFQQNIDKD